MNIDPKCQVTLIFFARKTIIIELAGGETVHKFTIKGNPATKKNSSQIISVNGRPVLIPSKKYRDYEKYAGIFLKPLRIDYPVNIKCLFYMQTKRKVDITNLLSAAMDVLVKYNVITDDNRDIAATNDGSMVLYDKENPRTEIEITKLEDYEKWSK